MHEDHCPGVVTRAISCLNSFSPRTACRITAKLFSATGMPFDHSIRSAWLFGNDMSKLAKLVCLARLLLQEFDVGALRARVVAA